MNETANNMMIATSEDLLKKMEEMKAAQQLFST